MSVTRNGFEDLDDFDCEEIDVEGRVDPEEEDSYWQAAFGREQYYESGLDYEDYAPAYCVGYIGYAQYGGEFGDAEKSLCANWMRIRGDSRLTLEQAMPAMRAAWNRMASRAAEQPQVDASWLARLLRQRASLPSLQLIPSMLR